MLKSNCLSKIWLTIVFYQKIKNLIKNLKAQENYYQAFHLVNKMNQEIKTVLMLLFLKASLNDRQ